MLIKNRQSFLLLLTLLLVGLVIPVHAANAESADCIEARPGDDARKCEAEDPVARWRRMQQDKRQTEQQKKKQEEQQEKPQEGSSRKIWNDDKGCNCPEPAKELEKEDPLLRWKRMQCERACHE